MSTGALAAPTRIVRSDGRPARSRRSTISCRRAAYTVVRWWCTPNTAIIPITPAALVIAPSVS